MWKRERRTWRGGIIGGEGGHQLPQARLCARIARPGDPGPHLPCQGRTMRGWGPSIGKKNKLVGLLHPAAGPAAEHERVCAHGQAAGELPLNRAGKGVSWGARRRTARPSPFLPCPRASPRSCFSCARGEGVGRKLHLAHAVMCPGRAFRAAARCRSGPAAGERLGASHD